MGYERCLNIAKMKENRVLKKKKTVDQNITQALEKDKPIGFGVTGTGIQITGVTAQALTGLNQDSVVGRRDLFKMPDFDQKGNIVAGRQVGAKKPPLKVNPIKSTHRFSQEESKVALLQGQSSIPDFNLAGTQIGLGQSFKSHNVAPQKSVFQQGRPHSLNGPPEIEE